MLYKIATASIMESINVDGQSLLPEGFESQQLSNKISHNDGKNQWEFIKKPGMLYFIARAVSVGTNGNADHFSEEELRKAYKTFVSKGLFVNHASTDVEKKRGMIIDAQWCEERGDKFVKCLVEFNASAYPELAQMIRSGHVDSVSMGAEIKYSECSACHNIAKKTSEFCDHVKFHKGSALGTTPIYEINHDIEFIELSLVSKPADAQAKLLEIIARQQGKDYKNLLTKAASMNFEVEAEDLIASKESVDHIVLKAVLRHRKEKRGE